MADKEKDVVAAATADDDPIPTEVTHTPIIITDGSAAFEYTESSYIQDPESNVNVANDDLHLVNIISDRPHTPGGNDFMCFEFQAGHQYEIEVKCVGGGGGFNNFLIRGSRDPMPPPEVEFDRSEYRRDPLVFPPRNPPTGHRFGSLGRRVRKVRIFELQDGHRIGDPVHDCSLVATAGNGWTIHDDHVTHDDDDHVDVVDELEVVQPA